MISVCLARFKAHNLTTLSPYDLDDLAGLELAGPLPLTVYSAKLLLSGLWLVIRCLVAVLLSGVGGDHKNIHTTNFDEQSSDIYRVRRFRVRRREKNGLIGLQLISSPAI